MKSAALILLAILTGTAVCGPAWSQPMGRTPGAQLPAPPFPEPTAEEAARLLQFYPPAALAAQVAGTVDLNCAITPRFGHRDCRIVSEEPAGHGFGDAAVRLALASPENPRLSGGSGRMPIHVEFSAAPATVRPNTLRMVHIITNPDYLSRPTVDQLSDLYPPEARSTGAGGRATVRCEISIEGRAVNCEPILEEPAGLGFGAAAIRVMDLFRFRPQLRDGEPVGGAIVVFPVRFPPQK